MEALRSLSLGDAERARGEYAEAIPFYEAAIDLDPGFALAYGRLGAAYDNLGEGDLAFEYKKRAYDLRDEVSTRERFYITSWYQARVSREIDKARATYLLWQETYPRDTEPVTNLAYLYLISGQFGEGLEQISRAVEIEPHPLNYLSLVAANMALDRIEEARRVAQIAIDSGYGSVNLLTELYRLHVLQGDLKAARELSDRATGTPQEYSMLETRAHVAASQGKLQEAGRLFRRASDLARSATLFETAGRIVAEEAFVAAIHGNLTEASNLAQTALAIHGGESVKLIAALSLALAGESLPALDLVEELSASFPLDTLLHSVSLPVIHAALLLNEEELFDAVRELESAQPYERAHLEAPYIRGVTHLAANQPGEAKAEFQKILASPGAASANVSSLTIHSLAHLGLARSEALAGNVEASRDAYERLFLVWQDAESKAETTTRSSIGIRILRLARPILRRTGRKDFAHKQDQNASRV